MIDSSPKGAVLAALSHEPDFSGLPALPPLHTKAGCAFLLWLDRSGLALTLLRQLQNHHLTHHISEPWRQALCRRQEDNFARTRDMLREVQHINAALFSFGVTAALLKGFSLSPDFCDDASLRHQVDFDFLVAPGNVSAAAEALLSCGYFTSSLNTSGETCFYTPSQHIPSSSDSLYALQHHRQVDLHVSIWEPCAWLPVQVPQDCLELAQPHNTNGVEYLGLCREDKFLLQVLHAFRHSFRSWIRLSWLLEISKFLENHRQNVSLWNHTIIRAGHARLTKTIFAFVLGLVARLFQTSIPLPLRSWTAEAMTVPLRAWLDYFAFDWAISDWPGSLNNLFLTAEFIPDTGLRRQYWRSRLLPRKAHASLGPVATTTPRKLLQLQIARFRYVARRAAVHLKDIVALPRQQLRWKRALAMSRRLGFDGNC